VFFSKKIKKVFFKKGLTARTKCGIIKMLEGTPGSGGEGRANTLAI
jgi:hypothetical protein